MVGEHRKRKEVPAALEMFTMGEVASILGVSRKLIRTWISEGALPAIRLGPGQRLVRIRCRDLEEFIARYEIVPPRQRRQPDRLEGELGRIAAAAPEKETGEQ